MLEGIPRPQLALYALGALVVVLLGARYLGGQSHGASTPPSAAGARPSGSVSVRSGSESAVVDVVGAVRRPGVYTLSSQDRVLDAVRRAGGATGHADLAQINLAAKLGDGQQIVVPKRGGAAAAGGAASGAAVGGATATPGAAGMVGAAGAPVDLNTAGPEQLDQLDGVGPATAQKIIEYRQAHGGFRSVQELDQVSGIGPKKLAALKDHVRV